MTLRNLEAGFVSADGRLVEFFTDVFQLEAMAPIEAGPGTLHRFPIDGAVLKVMVPKQTPVATEPVSPFFAASGLRYLTLTVDDLDGLLERAGVAGGQLRHGPSELGGGARIAILEDVEGNAYELVEVRS